MTINSELAQYIVNYMQKIFKYTINIMDKSARIIASTDSSRIGELHVGAENVLKTGNAYIIDEEESNMYSNVVSGISMPIFFKNELIGVVGVGAGEQADTVGKIIQSTTQLLVEQSYLKESVLAEEQATKEFFIHLLQEPWSSNEAYFDRQLNLHNFDFNQNYLLLIITLPTDVTDRYHSDEYESTFLHYEKSISYLTDTIARKIDIDGTNIVYIPNMLVCLIPVDANILADISQFDQTHINRLTEILRHILKDEYKIIISDIASDMSKIHEIYQQTLSVIKIITTFNITDTVIYSRKYYYESMLLQTDSELSERYVSRVLGKLIEEDKKSNMYIHTLDVFFNRDQCLVDTAKALFIHRNTLIFRLNRIGIITGYHPQSPNDAITLNAALTLYKFNLKLNAEGNTNA